MSFKTEYSSGCPQARKNNGLSINNAEEPAKSPFKAILLFRPFFFSSLLI
jgi:hypothetical protein